ncbi:MAG: hypothetical protein KQH83_06305 [Actinobacteria bacterium]|nr:hypothetical protein [Actinomycetota bacterium]
MIALLVAALPAAAGAQTLSTTVLDDMLEALPSSGRDAASLITSTPGVVVVDDPSGDAVHSTGAPAGFTPGYNEFTSFSMARLTVDDATAASDPYQSFVMHGADGGYWCLPSGFGDNDMIFTSCPWNQDPAALMVNPLSDALYVEWQLEADLPPATAGRCEFVLWGYDPGIGAAFGPQGDPNPYPYDPALGTNAAVGLGMNPDGERSTFGLEHPGTGGFVEAPTWSFFAAEGSRVAGIIPADEVADWTHLRAYSFCTREGYDYTPEGSGGDATDLLEFDFGGLPAITFQVSEPAPPTTTTTTSASTTTTVVEETPPTSIVVDDPETGTSYVGWWVGGGILLLVGAGVAFFARWNDPCIPLKARWARARKACADARKHVEATRRNLQTARDGLGDAEEALREQDAAGAAAREQLERLQRARTSYVESGGTRFHRIPEGLVTADGLESIIDAVQAQVDSHEENMASWRRSVQEWEKRVQTQEQHVRDAEAAAAEKCAAAEAARKAYEDCIKAKTAGPEPSGGEGPGGATAGGEGGAATTPPPEPGTAGPSGPASTPEPTPEPEPECTEGETREEELQRKSFTVPATSSSLIISIDPPTEEFAEWMAERMAAAGGWFAPSHLNDPGFARSVRERLDGLDSGMAVSHTVRIEIPRRRVTYACIQHWVCRGGRWVKAHRERRQVEREDLTPLVIEESGKTDSARVAQMIGQARTQYRRLVREDESISAFCR